MNWEGTRGRVRGIRGLALLLFGACVAPTAVSPSELDAFRWLEGTWVEEGEGTYLEEIWSSPVADAMVGSFRWVAGGELRVCELLVLRQEEDGVRMRLTHFAPDLTPMEEEPLVFAVEDSSPGLLLLRHTDPEFAGHRTLTYERSGDTLVVQVADHPDGEDALSFHFLLRP